MDYSEKEFSEQFYPFLIHGKKKIGLPQFNNVLPEFNAPQGKPDYIAVRKGSLKYSQAECLKFLDKSYGINGLEIVVRIYKTPGISFKNLCKKSDLTPKQILNILDKLDNKDLIAKDDIGGKITGHNLKKLFSSELWIFELKLKNWQKALYQASQARYYSNNVFVVFPMDKMKLLETKKDIFKKNGVGILLFDHETSKYQILIKPTSEKPVSKIYFLRALINTYMKTETGDNSQRLHH